MHRLDICLGNVYFDFFVAGDATFKGSVTLYYSDAGSHKQH